MKDIRDLIFTHPFFKDFPEDYLSMIAGCGKNVFFKAGEYIAKEGAPADSFYVIRKGIASIELHMPAKGGQVIQTVSSESIIGWSWIFPPYKWSFDIKTMEDISAVSMDATCLRRKCDTDHSFGYFLMKQFAQIMTERLSATRIRCLDIYNSNIKN